MTTMEKISYAFKHIRWGLVLVGIPFVFAGCALAQYQFHQPIGMPVVVLAIIISFLGEYFSAYRKAGKVKTD